MRSQAFTFYCDPGHAWLKVPLTLLEDLGLTGKISRFSYRSARFGYLEEDCDAGLFIEEYLRQTGMKRDELGASIKSKAWNDDAPCRLFEPYRV